MQLYSIILLLSVAGTPISTGVAWWLWSRGDKSQYRGWRSGVLLVGLVSASANTVMYYVWLGTRFIRGGTPLIWKAQDIFGDIAVPLIIVALMGAILGQGPSRIPLAVCALFAFWLWLPVGIL